MGREQKEIRAVKRLLLLGAGESGKSTVLKQLRLLHGEGFNENQRKTRKPTIYSNMIECMKEMLKFIDGCSSMEHMFNTAAEEEEADIIRNLEGEERTPDQLYPHVAQALLRLWESPAVQEAYERRYEYQLFDSCKYFLDRLPEICKPTWLPSDADILRMRSRTTGILSPHRLPGSSMPRRAWTLHHETSLVECSRPSVYNTHTAQLMVASQLRG